MKLPSLVPPWARKQVHGISAGMGSKALPGLRPCSSLGSLEHPTPLPPPSTSLPLPPQGGEVAAGPPELGWGREGVVYLSEQSSSAGSAREHLRSQTWLQPPGPGLQSDPQTAAGLRVPSNAFLCRERGKAGKTWGLGQIPKTFDEPLVKDLLT